MLSAIGLSDHVAGSADHYVELAVRLAADTGMLERLRRDMRGRMRGSRLLDPQGFARCLEQHYKAMLEKAWQ